MKLLSHLFVFAISIGLYTATAAPPDTNDIPPWQPTGKYIHPDIRESSSIVASRQFEGVYWTLNDSGNPASLYGHSCVRFPNALALGYKHAKSLCQENKLDISPENVIAL